MNPMRTTDVPMRVGQIMGKMLGGGVEAVVMNYYRHIDRAQVQFDFIVDDDSTAVPQEEIESLGGRVFRVAPYQQPGRNRADLLALFRENRYPIVHSHLNTLSVFPLSAAKKAGVPVRIAHSHSTAAPGEGAKSLMKWVFRPMAGWFPTERFACSEYAGEWLFGKRAMRSGDVRVIHNAIDIERYTYNEEVRREMRRELGLDGKFVVGHIGRFCYQKNHTFLLKIFHQLHKRCPEAALLLIGEGELRPKIQARVKEMGLSDAVHILGQRSDADKLYQAMDCFVLPSRYEGLPLVGVEAQTAGLPSFVSSAVTSETKVSPLLEFCSLKESADVWADKFLQARETSRIDMGPVIARAGFDIRREAQNLCDAYLSLARKAEGIL